MKFELLPQMKANFFQSLRADTLVLKCEDILKVNPSSKENPCHKGSNVGYSDRYLQSNV